MTRLRRPKGNSRYQTQRLIRRVQNLFMRRDTLLPWISSRLNNYSRAIMENILAGVLYDRFDDKAAAYRTARSASRRLHAYLDCSTRKTFLSTRQRHRLRADVNALNHALDGINHWLRCQAKKRRSACPDE